MAVEKVSYIGTLEGNIYKVQGPRNVYQLKSGLWESVHSGDPEQYASIDPIEIRTESRREIKDFALKKAMDNFKKFVVDSTPEHFTKKNMYYEPGDEDAPFLTEGFLYPLLGKEDARSVLGYIRRLESVITGL